jgi:hypothetical protein
MRIRLAVLLTCLGLPCAAQTPPSATAASASASAAPIVRDSGPSVAQRGGEPKVQRLVSEDDAVRIDELRVRGVTRKLTVQPKLPGAPAYEIGSNRDGRDATQDPRSEGRALWQLFAF